MESSIDRFVNQIVAHSRNHFVLRCRSSSFEMESRWIPGHVDGWVPVVPGCPQWTTSVIPKRTERPQRVFGVDEYLKCTQYIYFVQKIEDQRNILEIKTWRFRILVIAKEIYSWSIHTCDEMRWENLLYLRTLILSKCNVPRNQNMNEFACLIMSINVMDRI